MSGDKLQAKPVDVDKIILEVSGQIAGEINQLEANNPGQTAHIDSQIDWGHDVAEKKGELSGLERLRQAIEIERTKRAVHFTD